MGIDFIDQSGETRLVGRITGTDEAAQDHSYQTIGPDLELGPGSGRNTGTSYFATVMGNLLGDALTKTKNYLGGLIGAYSVTGAKATTYPSGAVLAQITDGVTDVDGAFVAYIDGDGAQTNCGAMFKVRSNNSTPGSGPQFGLDLQDAAHDGYLPVGAAFYKSAPLRIVSDVVFLVGDPNPTDNVTGVNVAGPGSLYFAVTTPKLWINTNTKANLTWIVVGSQVP